MGSPGFRSISLISQFHGFFSSSPDMSCGDSAAGTSYPKTAVNYEERADACLKKRVME